jgi:hypothetical protein
MLATNLPNPSRSLQISLFLTDAQHLSRLRRTLKAFWTGSETNPKDQEGPATAAFKKMDQMLPDKPGQTPEDRAKDIDNNCFQRMNISLAQFQFSFVGSTRQTILGNERRKDRTGVFERTQTESKRGEGERRGAKGTDVRRI